jgi:hypothetical protein
LFSALSDFSQFYTISQFYRGEFSVDSALACIQIKTQSIRILILESSTKKVAAFDEIQFTRTLALEDQILQFQHFLPKSGLSSFPVERVQMVFEPAFFTLIPSPIWDPNFALDYLLQTGDPDFDFQIVVQSFGDGHHLVYALPLHWINWAKQLFESSEMQWRVSLIALANLGMEKWPHEASCLFACVENHYVFLMAFKNGALQYLNRFEFKTENDLLYFALLAAQTCGISTEKDKFFICGSLMPSSLGFEKLNRYFGSLEFVSEKSQGLSDPAVAFLQQSVYFDLMSQIPHLPL